MFVSVFAADIATWNPLSLLRQWMDDGVLKLSKLTCEAVAAEAAEDRLSSIPSPSYPWVPPRSVYEECLFVMLDTRSQYTTRARVDGSGGQLLWRTTQQDFTRAMRDLHLGMRWLRVTGRGWS